MRKISRSLIPCSLILSCVAGACVRAAAPSATVPVEEARREVEATERAFARTMAARDSAAFAGFVAADAIFFDGKQPLRGREQVVRRWASFFEGAVAPFSWEPAQVEVLESGTLALSTGPVRDPDGRTVATFSSIWRREAPGVWRIVFDKGNDVCNSTR